MSNEVKYNVYLFSGDSNGAGTKPQKLLYTIFIIKSRLFGKNKLSSITRAMRSPYLRQWVVFDRWAWDKIPHEWQVGLPTLAELNDRGKPLIMLSRKGKLCRESELPE